jgi:hypothetical protein
MKKGKYIINFGDLTIEQVLDKKQKKFLKEIDGQDVDFVVNKFENVSEMLAFLLPDNFSHKDFLQLEASYLQLYMQEDAWMTIEQYKRALNVSRATIYNRIKAGELESKKDGGFTYVREIND